MSRAFFEQVVEALVGFLPPERQEFSSRVTGRNVKVWFGSEPREHYEVQMLRRDGEHVLEVGFHAEYPDAALNQEALARLRAGERRWRRTLGDTVETGPFLAPEGRRVRRPVAGAGAGDPGPTAMGRQAKSHEHWGRASETWDGVDLSDPGAAVEAADRLAEYIGAFEPLRTRGA